MALNETTIPLCLAALDLQGEDWGPDLSSHAALAAGWRGSVPCPTEAELEAVRAAAEIRAAAMAEILALEAEVTQRRLREAVLTKGGATWLAAQEALIATERAKL